MEVKIRAQRPLMLFFTDDGRISDNGRRVFQADDIHKNSPQIQ